MLECIGYDLCDDLTSYIAVCGVAADTHLIMDTLSKLETSDGTLEVAPLVVEVDAAFAARAPQLAALFANSLQPGGITRLVDGGTYGLKRAWVYKPLAFNVGCSIEPPVQHILLALPMASGPAPVPASPLARYRRLSSRAGVYVSPIQLGTMSVGDKWNFFGSCSKEDAFAYLDTYFNAGGNFIDTANIYHEGQTEEWIGEWMEARGNRDQIVLATKYTGGIGKVKPAALLGNGVKNMTLSVEASLKRLRTHYVDILYVHWWDWTSSVEEIMHGLWDLVARGKVLYLGICNAPAWKAAQANQYARDHGKPQFVVYQGGWNILDRDVEREILPMCREYGMAFAAFNVLAGGRLRTDAEEEARTQAGSKPRIAVSHLGADWKRTEKERSACAVVEQIAKEVGTTNIRAVLLAYHLQKMPYVFPLVGGNKPAQLQANAEAITITLSDEQIKQIDDIAPVDLGYPYKHLGSADGSTPNLVHRRAIYIDVEPLPAAIRPVQQ